MGACKCPQRQRWQLARCRITTLHRDRARGFHFVARFCNEQTADAQGSTSASLKCPRLRASEANLEMDYRQPFAAVFVSASSTPDAQALAKL
jgi:hypothetical protein